MELLHDNALRGGQSVHTLLVGVVAAAVSLRTSIMADGQPARRGASVTKRTQRIPSPSLLTPAIFRMHPADLTASADGYATIVRPNVIRITRRAEGEALSRAERCLAGAPDSFGNLLAEARRGPGLVGGAALGFGISTTAATDIDVEWDR